MGLKSYAVFILAMFVVPSRSESPGLNHNEVALVSSGSSPRQAVTTSASTCGELGWSNADQFGSKGVCGLSQLNNQCSGQVAWSEAFSYCDAAGARLCTVAELLNDEARSTGCSGDRALVWSSEMCSGGYSVAPGSTKIGTSPSCQDVASAYRVRCCADVVALPALPAPTKAPTASAPAVSTKAPSLFSEDISASTCSELGWNNAPAFGSHTVCGESDSALGGCSGELSWSDDGTSVRGPARVYALLWSS